MLNNYIMESFLRTVTQLLNKFLSFYVTWRSITTGHKNPVHNCIAYFFF